METDPIQWRELPSDDPKVTRVEITEAPPIGDLVKMAETSGKVVEVTDTCGCVLIITPSRGSTEITYTFCDEHGADKETKQSVLDIAERLQER